MKKILICFLIVIVIATGCLQRHPVTGDYRNEAHNSQYIVFTDAGTFSHSNYDNTYGLSKTGDFSVKDNLLIMHYKDGQITEYSIDGYELIPVMENQSEPMSNLRQNRFAKRLEQ